MAFYLVGIGLNKNSISADALEILKTCDKIYLEDYTVNFPYPINELEKEVGSKFVKLKRTTTENGSIIKESKDKNIALLVYGDSLSATTHIQLILECKNQEIKYKVFHNASIMTAIAGAGLQLYKFGKTTSMPNWKEHTNRPASFMNYVKENRSIKAHTLILTDIGLKIENAINQLKTVAEKEGIDIPEKIIVCSNVGTQNQKIFYDAVDNFKDIKMPFCLIIPGEMHFLEEEALEKLKDKLI
ncbi:MAG: diphthine synthase [Nanoarchaeota archaeon]|nr:diphthine synthase [Nanoarchaeota archaeon]